MSKTLLLADDSVVIQKLVGLSFANEDVEIVSTDNGDDAVIKARELRPDVILADVVMPGKSGYEVCEAIKQDSTLAHIPVLLLTGTFEAFDESRASGVGADGHITKPFEAQALVERVKNVIKNARPPAAPARTALPSAPIPTDDLFDDGDTLLAAPPARPGFFGRSESLDVTPSLSEEDLSDSLDVDLFGPPGGEVGGPSFGANALSRGDSSGYSSSYSSSYPSGASNASSGRFADAPIEDATIAILPEPAVVLPPLVVAMEPIAVDAFADDLGFDDPLQVSELPLASFDLDSAFDPAPLPPPTLLVARDDANAATARNFGKSSFVTDLDELLASPSTPSTAPRMTPPPIPRPNIRPDIRPEAPTVLDLGPVARSGEDLDFGFDVSEQVAVSKVDLFEESFSSLLDVSESQILGDPAPASWNDSSPAAPGLSSPTVVADFDVSSSDLATAAPIFASPIPAPAQTPAWSTGAVTPAPSPSRRDADLDFFLSEIPAPATPSPASQATSPAAFPVSSSAASPSANAAVAHMSPILQQQVQETLEKVAWEAFSDLSETIVKQVIERVERIAWEVIPQMAETLVREEIRKLKGEED